MEVLHKLGRQPLPAIGLRRAITAKASARASYRSTSAATMCRSHSRLPGPYAPTRGPRLVPCAARPRDATLVARKLP